MFSPKQILKLAEAEIAKEAKTLAAHVGASLVDQAHKLLNNQAILHQVESQFSSAAVNVVLKQLQRAGWYVKTPDASGTVMIAANPHAL